MFGAGFYPFFSFLAVDGRSSACVTLLQACYGLGFGVCGLGFGVWCWGFVWDLWRAAKVEATRRVWSAATCTKVCGLGFGVWGLEFRVWGSWFMV